MVIMMTVAMIMMMKMMMMMLVVNGDGGVAACPGLGNQDWALGPIELPSEKRA